MMQLNRVSTFLSPSPPPPASLPRLQTTTSGQAPSSYTANPPVVSMFDFLSSSDCRNPSASLPPQHLIIPHSTARDNDFHPIILVPSPTQPSLSSNDFGNHLPVLYRNRPATTLPPLVPQSANTTSSSAPRLSSSPTRSTNSKSSPQSSCLPSPTKERRLFMTTLTGDKPAEVKVEEQGGKLAGWFKGESEAVNISILPSPTKEKADPMEVLSKHSTIRPASNVRARPLSQAPVAPTLTPTRRFSFFGAKVASPKLPVHRPFLDDELLDLDIHSALLPAGPPDIVTPASFKTLLHNAESVLSRLQAVCRQRTISLEDMTVETETQTEELKGADTRARHLKMQLDDMAAEVLEQNKAMMNLVDELAKEKELRRQEDDARKRSVMLVKSSRVDSMSKNGSRKSRCSLASDSGFESEEDSFTDSVFTTQQGATSPTRTLSSASSTHSPETYHHFQVPALPTKMQGARNRPITNAPLSSTYQRLMKESSMPDGFNFPPLGSEEPLRWSCANCSGIKASEAFSVVGVLKEENKVLKQRVGQMESALDGCLELVDKLGL